MLFTTVGGRRIIGIEALMLQGFPIDQLELSQITQAQQMDLAGNAMSSTVIGAATLAALAKFPKLFDRKKGNPEALELKFNPHLDGENELVPKTMDPTTYEEKTVDEAKSLVRLTRRLCYCEGRQNNWAIDFQQCQVCNSTTCTRCGRKPRHDYVLISKTVIGERKRPAEFEQLLKKCLPMKITFAHPLANSKEYVDSLFEIHRHGIDPELWLLIKPAIEIAFSSEVYFRSIRRVENWQVVYDSSKARVVLVLSEEKVEWLLYANVDREPLSSHYRRYLEQFPIARMQAQGQLTRGDWSFWLPNEREVKAMITGKGQLVKSYEATCGLTNHLETYVWSEYSVDIAKKDYAFFEHPIHGNYELSSQCGQAFNSLHVRKESQGSKTPLFFYFEHQRMSGDPKKHFFVFTHDKSRLGHGEPRRTIARLLPSWHQPRVQAIQTAESLKFMTEESEELIDRSEIPTEKQVKIYVDGRWTELPQFSFNFLDRTPVTIYQLPQKLLSPIRNSCKSQRAALTVRATHLGEISSSWIRGQWTLITRENEADFIRSFRWMFEHGLVMDGYSQMTERRDGIENWRGIRACTNHHPCLACSPAPPKMLWAFKYGKQEPFEDPEEATVYEQSLKSRPLPINIMYYTDGRDNFEIKIGINPESLICRAKARLGCKNYAHEISTSWRLVTDDDSARKPELPPLTLKTHSAVEGTVVGPWESRPIFHRLLSHQRGPFIWMYHQERFPKYFTQEEVVEAQVPHIGYRVEGKAASTIPLRGGVANYPVGSGKTAEMLALIDSLRDEDKQHAQQLSNGTIYLKATIIFVPTALSRQWSSEIKKFLPEQKDNVLVIQNFKQFQKLTVEDFMNAEIIVMNVEILKSPQYSFLLAQFAGIVECAENESPRAKAAWYRMALEKVPGNVALLAANPSQFQANLKEQFKHDFHKSQSATTPIPSKRTTGASFQTWEQRRAKMTKKESKAELQPREDIFFPRASDGYQRLELVNSPPVEMFNFARVVVDEYQYIKDIVAIVIGMLNAKSHWILSGTPALGGFLDVNNAVKLLGVSLGVNDFGAMTPDEFKKATSGMTSKSSRFEIKHRTLTIV
jgi:hypothetical protein